jgi:hypothetical protein
MNYEFKKDARTGRIRGRSDAWPVTPDRQLADCAEQRRCAGWDKTWPLTSRHAADARDKDRNYVTH